MSSMASTKKMNPAPSSVFQEQFESIRAQLFLPETEETWDTIARSITALAASCSDTDSYAPAELVVAMRSISRPLISAMNSERGRLSGVAIDLVALVASSLGVAFDPLLSHFFPVLLTLSSRTSKVMVARARTCILTIIDATHLPPVLSYLLQSVTDKSVSLRLTVVESTLACMNCFNPPDLEKDVRAKEIEAIIRITARDANADVRKFSRKVFEAYKLLLPSRLESFATPLTPTTRKYLDIQNKATDKLKPSHSHLPPPPKGNHLSSSTSAMRGPSSRRPPTHTRSASSPAVGPEVAAQIGEHRPRSRAKADMAPPRLPEAATQPSRQPVMVRSTSVIERKRVVSMSATVRPVMPIIKPGAAERGRPIPVSNQPAGRTQPVDDARQPSSVVARRVPISEVQKPDAEKAIRAHPRIDNSASTPAIRQATVPTPPLAQGSKPPVPKFVRNKDGAFANRATVKPKGREPTKSSLMQPTLSQIARAKTIERRVPVPTASKSQRGKAAPRKPLPISNGEPSAHTAGVTPAPDEQGVPSAHTSPIADHEPQAVEVSKEEVNDEDGGARAKEDLVADTTSPPRPETPSSETQKVRNIEVESDEARIVVTGTPSGPSNFGLVTPPRGEKSTIALSKTPISELLLSIERGFLFTPSDPLSPPQSYLTLAPPGNLPIPFPLQTLWSEQQNEESGETTEKPIEGVRRLEARRALGDVAINK